MWSAPATRTVSVPVIVLAMIVQIVLSVICNQVLFPRAVFGPVSEITGGVVSQTLCANVLMMAINIGIVVMVVGRLGARDIGLCPSKRALVWSIAVAGGLWLCAQLTLAVAALTGGGPVSIAASWSTPELAGPTVGRLIGQVFGNALYEEALFRGFLLIQIGLLLASRRTQAAGSEAPRAGFAPWIVAIVITQVFFALIHIPNRLMSGSYGGVLDVLSDQGMLVAGGVLYAVIYLGTRNLWLCVLLHALFNAPTPLLASADGANGGANVIAIGQVVVFGIAVWLLLQRRRSSASLPAPGS